MKNLVKFICKTSFLFLFFSCKNSNVDNKPNQVKTITNAEVKVAAPKPFETVVDSAFVNLLKYSDAFVLDMKYATKDNFLKEKVYDCPECYLRYKTVKALMAANSDFEKLGYKIKMFDCYRPLDIQKKMWKIMPNTNYVASPTKGSMHNRGGAVDITLVDKNGKDLDMGTEFDFFGPEAGHKYTNLSKQVLKNRKLLKKIMLKNGFEHINSEWWHYNLTAAKTNKVSNFTWKCN